MSVSASEVAKMGAAKKPAARRSCTEEFRVEAARYYLKAREIDPEKTIRDCAGELGVNDKTLNDRVIRFGGQGGVTRERSDERRELDEARRRIRELELENEFPKKAAALFARSQA